MDRRSIWPIYIYAFNAGRHDSIIFPLLRSSAVSLIIDFSLFRYTDHGIMRKILFLVDRRSIWPIFFYAFNAGRNDPIIFPRLRSSAVSLIVDYSLFTYSNHGICGKFYFWWIADRFCEFTFMHSNAGQILSRSRHLCRSLLIDLSH